jgi:hypothetical protein
MLDSAYNLDLGLDGDFDYVPDYWPTGDPGWDPHGRRLVWPVAALSLTHAVQLYGDRPLPEVPVLGSHYPISRGIHPLDHGGRPVVLVRNPTPAIRSLLVMRDVTDPAHEHPAVRMAGNYVRFFHHWARQLEVDRTGRILLVRYEDLEADPAASVRAISEHWDLGLGDASIANAVALCARERMAAKAGADPRNTRVSSEERAPVDPELLARLDRILREELRESLGYELPGDGGARSSPTSATSRSDDRPSR